MEDLNFADAILTFSLDQFNLIWNSKSSSESYFFYCELTVLKKCRYRTHTKKSTFFYYYFYDPIRLVHSAKYFFIKYFLHMQHCNHSYIVCKWICCCTNSRIFSIVLLCSGNGNREKNFGGYVFQSSFDRVFFLCKKLQKLRKKR